MIIRDMVEIDWCNGIRSRRMKKKYICIRRQNKMIDIHILCIEQKTHKFWQPSAMPDEFFFKFNPIRPGV